MIPNKTLLQKADHALSELTTDGGALMEAQAKKFLIKLIKQGKLMQWATVTPMSSFKQEVNKIGLLSRIMRPGQPGVALGLADRSKPTLSRVELDAKLYKGEIRLPKESLEDNIEGDALQSLIMDLMSERIAADLDELFINGDTASADPYLATLDGLLKQATSHVVAAGGTVLTKNVLKATLKALPIQYQRDKSKMRMFTSPNTETEFADAVSDRTGGYGDKVFMDGADGDLRYQKVPLTPLPMWPENLGGGQDETNLIYTDPKNINVGVWRKVQVETDIDIAAGVILIVVSMRVDMKYIEEDAVVKTTGVKVNA